MRPIVYVPYWESLERLTRRGQASTVIRHLPELLAERPGLRVVDCCRVSEYQQGHRGQLAGQVSDLQQQVEQLGANVIDCVKHVGPGWDPGWLYRALKIARATGAVLVAETTSRFIRSGYFHSSRLPNAQATQADLDYLRFLTDGVALATVLHPDASPEEEMGYHRKRGQRATGNVGGRPERKKNRRKRLTPPVIDLRQQGKSLAQIAKELDVPRSTIQRWVAPNEGVPFCPKYLDLPTDR